MRMRCLQIANAWQTNCNNVANNRRMRGERIATTWRTDANAWLTNCECVANGLQQCNIQKTKTILLHVKNHTFVMRICNIQKTNTLRTFRECVANTPKWVANTPQYTHVHPRNGLRTDCEYVANGLPNIADGLPKRCKTRCIIRTSHNNAPTYKHKKTYKIYNRI